MKKLFFLLAIFALTVMQAQAQPTPRDIIKLALGVSDAQLPKVYEVWGKKLGTVNTTRDTVWDISPVPIKVDSVAFNGGWTYTYSGTRLDSVVSHINETHTPRPAYAYEILSEWRKQTIDEWKAIRQKAQEDSVKQVVTQSIAEPTF